MRVLTIVSDLGPGGTQRVAQNFATGYRRFGQESALFAYETGGPREAPLREAGVEVFLGGVSDTEQRDGLHRALSWEPDVVHIHRTGLTHPRTGAMLAEVKQRRRRGASAPPGVLETNVFARVDYSAHRSCIDVHLHLSRWCLWKWRRWSRYLSPRPIGVVLPNLVMHEDFRPAPPTDRAEFRTAHSIPCDALVFGRIGSKSMPKWSAAVFDAFRAYAPGNPRAWMLLVGMPDELRPALEALPEPLRARVRLIDFLHGDAALNRAYGAMDVFLHASMVGESFGMVFAESLLCGTPVITLSTPVRDNSQLEVVGHEVGGLVAASVDGMVRAMRRLEDPALRSRLATNGATGIAARFGPEVLMPRAIRLAELTSRGLGHAKLAALVRQDPDLVTDVPDSEIRGLLGRAMGHHRVKDLAMMRLVSNPLLYRAYLAFASKPA